MYSANDGRVHDYWIIINLRRGKGAIIGMMYESYNESGGVLWILLHSKGSILSSAPQHKELGIIIIIII